jgi:hypothetical protein
MDYEVFTRHLGKAGMQIQEFAALIGVHATSISKYSKSEIPRKYAVLAVLLGDAVDRSYDYRSVLDRYGISWRGAKKSGRKVTSIAEYRGHPQK